MLNCSVTVMFLSIRHESAKGRTAAALHISRRYDVILIKP
jgi:hypothetical protein